MGKICIRDKHPGSATLHGGGLCRICLGRTLIQTSLNPENARYSLDSPKSSVADPDPHVFGPPGSGSGSISQRYGSGSLYH
jgi:hypothetical protein